ncbi:hypothetical protein OAC41_06415 [Acidimicrobiales bacterium]|nr:hypothetical protein [Acidimicrobiales bacterium]MDC0350050.1 hypothetical protein [bacterium]
MSGPLEVDFESTICSWLVEHGAYVGPVKVGNAQGNPRDFDAVRGLDTAELFAFIGATQAANSDARHGYRPPDNIAINDVGDG